MTDRTDGPWTGDSTDYLVQLLETQAGRSEPLATGAVFELIRRWRLAEEQYRSILNDISRTSADALRTTLPETAEAVTVSGSVALVNARLQAENARLRYGNTLLDEEMKEFRLEVRRRLDLLEERVGVA